MVCPECKAVFRGRAFYFTGTDSMWRRCPNGHEFQEPPKKRYKTKEQRKIAGLIEWAEKISLSNMHQEYRKGVMHALAVINGETFG
jgi:hypothetical protein